MESTLRLVLAESQKWNIAKHCVLTSYCSESEDEYKGSLIANELQDFISDSHS